MRLVTIKLPSHITKNLDANLEGVAELTSPQMMPASLWDNNPAMIFGRFKLLSKK